MDYLERYRTGEYAQVWDDLQSLGETMREEPHYTQAREVAAETMRRVRRNCERLISNLCDLGYVVGLTGFDPIIDLPAHVGVSVRSSFRPVKNCRGHFHRRAHGQTRTAGG